MIKLSKASKMPCKSWSLQALDTCPGSKQKDGTLVDACKGCYATTGNYNFPNVKEPRLHNKEDWKRSDWVDEMVSLLSKEKYFRWFDSGDMYHHTLGHKILRVMIQTPHVQHWLPTRMHKFPKFQKILDAMETLDNVVVRKSSDSVTGGTIKGIHTSTIVPILIEDGKKRTISKSLLKQYTTPEMAVCPAYSNDGKCGTCRSCWDKSVSVVAYPAHGKKMQKVINIITIN